MVLGRNLIPASLIPARPRSFLTLWFGQQISMIGSGMTSFALAIMTYKESGSASELATVILAFSLPGVLASPLAGVLVDRYDRRWVLTISALGSALSTLSIAAAVFSGGVRNWQIYICVAGISFFGAAQWPTVTAFTTVLIPKHQYARANGFWQLAQGLSLIIAPLMAASLLVRIGVQGIVVIDFCTYLVAVATVFIAALPRGAVQGEKEPAINWNGLTGGWRYIRSRPALLQLLCFHALTFFMLNMVQVLIVPMELNLGTEKDLAKVVVVSSVGMIVGGIVLAAWGGPRRRVAGVFGACIVLGVGLAVVGSFPRLECIAAGMFVLAVAIPIGLGCNGAIWQLRTGTAYQGRVFAIKSMVAESTLPIACLAAGPLVDRIFDPLMMPGGALALAFGSVTGTGRGRGAGVLLALLGGVVIVATLIGGASPRLRRIEEDLAAAELSASVPELSAPQHPAICGAGLEGRSRT
jgi:MFS transporter, DHA3 family, macrolide efflux protein